MSSSVPAQSATIATYAASTTSGTLLAAGGSRRAWLVSNTSGQILYLRFAADAATAANYSVAIASGGYYECPQPVYAGAVTAITAAGAGNVQVTSW